MLLDNNKKQTFLERFYWAVFQFFIQRYYTWQNDTFWGGIISTKTRCGRVTLNEALNNYGLSKVDIKWRNVDKSMLLCIWRRVSCKWCVKRSERCERSKRYVKEKKFATTLVDKYIKIFLNKQFSENFRTYKNYFTISWYVFPLFEKTLTKKHQQQHFIL